MESAYTIRRADQADLKRLEDLMSALQDHLEASNPSLWRMTPQGRRQLKAQLASRLDAPAGCALVAEHARDGIVGTAFGRVTANSRYIPSRAGSVDQLYVHPCHRRAGVGTRLVLALCEFFAQAGVDDLTLRFVVGNQEAAAFWADLGFEPRILTVGARRQAVEARYVPPRDA
jgi:ribosomal protein S18 acetylase RimI-like enzyme